ncbi:MAG: redox-sensing transcriptional repressor Rex, partial [Phycisphaerae bacterium]|nr:redox-sensing transcriptional repressor Rex [Phycisphaerae bacterium]
QAVADALVAAGVRGILNFAPRRLDVHGAVPTIDVDFTSALQRLSFEVGTAAAPTPATAPAKRPRRS